MNMEAKFSALKGYIDREISFLNSKIDQFIESLKETITKIEKRESSSTEIFCSAKYSFFTEGAIGKERFNKIPDGKSDSCIKGYNKP